jgi:hypothetical protein
METTSPNVFFTKAEYVQPHHALLRNGKSPNWTWQYFTMIHLQKYFHLVSFQFDLIGLPTQEEQTQRVLYILCLLQTIITGILEQKS